MTIAELQLNMLLERPACSRCSSFPAFAQPQDIGWRSVIKNGTTAGSND